MPTHPLHLDAWAGKEPPSLQARLEVAGERSGDDPVADVTAAFPTITDPGGLFRHLEESGRFHRDIGLGRLFHPGCVSLREARPTDSLHLVIRHNRIAAHVDRVSPLHPRPAPGRRYSVRRAAAHNLAGMAQDLVRLLRGRQGDHRSELDCRWVWDSPESAPGTNDLLDPAISAWSVQLEARVSGVLDEMRLRRALAAVLGHGPATHDVLRVVDCRDDAGVAAARVQLQGAPVPLSEWPPWRAHLARHPAGDVLMLNVNHAASDGVGALRVLRSISEAYADEAGADRSLDFLAVSDLPVRPATATVSRFTAWNQTALEALRNLVSGPARLAPDQGGDDPGYGFHLIRLSVGETNRIVVADRPGTSRNILVAGLHLAIRDWNRQHRAPGRRIGVLLQVNLRPPQWRDETIGNFSVTARVSSSRRHWSSASAALKAITAETTRNKRTRSGIALVAALQRTGLLPLWAKQSLVVLQPLTRNRFIDAAVLSNIGSLDEPLSFGDDAGEVVDVWFSPPSRAPLGVCIGAVIVAGELHLVIRYPRRLFSADAARRFADCYLAEVFLVAASRP